jgi:hypothetical protein
VVYNIFNSLWILSASQATRKIVSLKQAIKIFLGEWLMACVGGVKVKLW